MAEKTVNLVINAADAIKAIKEAQDALNSIWFTDSPTIGRYWAYNERRYTRVELIDVVNDRGGIFARLNNSIVALSEFTHFKAADVPERLPKVAHAQS